MASILIGLILLVVAKKSSATNTTCDAACRAQTAADWEAEQHAQADFGFYTVPSNFSPDLDPGELLYVEESTDLANYTIPTGLSLSRIIYTTSNLNGTTVPTSAYVLWPYTPFSPSGSSSGSQNESYPMVAWAHGTSGLHKKCAPSNYRNLQYHFMVPFELALQGMVVVAPDYAGLGFDTLPSGEHIGHAWLAGPSQATDLANAITAARTAFPQYLKPSGPFVAMGHSQGGQATWALSERMADKPIEGYKGTVAVAPTNNQIRQAEVAESTNSSEPWAVTARTAGPKLAAAVTAVFPSYNFSGLTDEAYHRWNDILTPLSGCVPTDTFLFSDLAPEVLTKPNWTDDEAVQAYSKLIDTGRKQFKGPMLIVAGDTDGIVSIDDLENAVDDTCDMLDSESWNESIEMVTYAQMNHFPIIKASSPRWMDWVKARFSPDSSTPSVGCTKKRVTGMRETYGPQVPSPNYLVGWAPGNEFWKFLL
jgi:pimeloyl-ACP methyl ester carboxylesterase